MPPRGTNAIAHPALNINSWIRSIDLMSLRLFASVVEERNIGRAAAREAIAASAVTRRMNDLETSLGFKLLYRDAKGTTLTPAGEQVYQHVRDILRSLDDLRHGLDAFSHGIQGHIRVWATESALVQYLANDIAAFTRLYPQVAFAIHEADSTDVYRATALGTADVGICTQPDECSTRIRVLAYRQDRLVAVMTRDHPLVARDSLTFAELLDADLIGWTETTGLMRMLRQAAQQLGREFQPKYQVASSQTARSLVRAGLGIAVQPEGTIWPYEDAEHMSSVRLTDPWTARKLSILIEAERPPSSAVQAFIRHLQGVAEAQAAD